MPLPMASSKHLERAARMPTKPAQINFRILSASPSLNEDIRSRGSDLIRRCLDISGGSIQDVAQALADTGRRE